MKALRIRLRSNGGEFLLFGTLESGGPVATEDQYRHGRVSFAHFYSEGEGEISRFGRRIGARADIEVLGEAPEPEMEADAFGNILRGLDALL